MKIARLLILLLTGLLGYLLIAEKISLSFRYVTSIAVAIMIASITILTLSLHRQIKAYKAGTGIISVGVVTWFIGITVCVVVIMLQATQPT